MALTNRKNLAQKRNGSSLFDRNDFLSCIIAPALLFVLLVSTDAYGVTRQDKAVFGYAVAPYHQVGNLSEMLSYACQRREFSQKRQFRYIIGFVGPTGKAVTGIATTDWNLYDPKDLSIDGMTYHFYNDGYSDCQVYVSPQPRN